ncbi:hypothetical protein, partial [Pseudomonas syringae]|uniref:hypothetical protein n=1 Tax=Pseudomonas syringae TaxID=317 RepID=UPI001C556D4A
RNAKQGRQVEKNRLGNEDGANGLIVQRLLSVACPLTNRRPNVQSLRHAKSCSKANKTLLTNMMYFQLKIA